MADDSSKPTATTILRSARTRTELRAFIESELPGWSDWLTTAQATIQWRAQDLSLRPEGELRNLVLARLDEWYAGDASAIDAASWALAQLRPAFDPNEALTALRQLGPGDHLGPDAPFAAHRAARLRAPQDLVALLGALAVVRAQDRPGRRPNLRLAWAIEAVIEDLAPYSPQGGGRAGPVIPPQQQDRLPPPEALRTKPITLALVAVVAVYLSLPNRNDPEYDPEPGYTPDPELLVLAPHLHRDTMKVVGLRLKTIAEDAGETADAWAKVHVNPDGED